MASGGIRSSFRSVAALGRAAGFDLGFRQLDAGPQEIPATLQLGEHLTLVRMSFNRSYHQLGSAPEGKLTLGIPLGGLRNWYGRDYPTSSLLPFNVPGGIDGVSEPGFEAFTLSVSSDFVREVGESCQIPIADVLVDPSTDAVIADSRPTRFFRSQLASIFEDQNARLASEVEDELIVSLLDASLTETARLETSEPAQRSRAISRAMAFLADTPDEMVGVRDLSSHTGVPLRTLHRAFRERFGIGPKAYLVRRRLSSVRAELRRAPGGTLVADVANRWGFWHLGQFAKDYRRSFGELPSETLRRART